MSVPDVNAQEVYLRDLDGKRYRVARVWQTGGAKIALMIRQDDSNIRLTQSFSRVADEWTKVA